MAVALLICALLQPQDDFDTWILKLGHESIEEREAASRNLQRLGPAALTRLEKARDSAGDPEVKARIGSILQLIRKEADLAKVLGPTRRVTIAARGEPLKEVLRSLHTSGVSEILAGAFDEEMRIDMQVRGVTWWEALDTVARTVKGRYRIDANRDGRFKVTFVKGTPDAGAIRYAEQLRISVSETRRVELRTADGMEEAGMVIVELRYQPDLKPLDRTFEDRLIFESITDSKGKHVLLDGLRRVHPATTGRQPLSEVKMAWVRADAAPPLVVTGRTNVRFPGASREIGLDLEGEGSTAQIGGVRLAVEPIQTSRNETRVKLTAKTGGESGVADRIQPGAVHLVDAKGEKHPGYSNSTMRSTGECSWEFDFTSGIEGPRRLLIRWTTEFHPIELPFRLEGIRLPESP